MAAMTTTSGAEPFYQVWIRALSKPSETTFSDLAASPQAKATRAFLWIFLSSFAPALVSVLVSGTQISQRLEEAGIDLGQAGGSVGASLINLLCITPFVAVASVLTFIVTAGVMQWIARLFRGQGTFDQLAYSLGAIGAPGLLVSAVLTLPSLVPVLGICSGLISFLFGLYLVVLEVTAIKGVHKFGWGAAIGTFIIPGLALGLLACCLAFVIASALGLAVGDVWSTINQSLAQ